jgi:23S rRNA (pseudouridine1915-N3)-methyltransferase
VRVRVAWFGRPRRSPYEGQVADYLKRVSRRWPAEDLPLKPASGGRDLDPGRVLKAEADALRRVRPEGWRLVVLDEAGQTVTSGAFAEAMGKAEDGGCSGVVFAIGSDLGLDTALRREADWTLSLSRLTLPHLLARLTLWEQLYRASDILGGGGYHRF